MIKDGSVVCKDQNRFDLQDPGHNGEIFELNSMPVDLGVLAVLADH
jgi:hypothetical protein